MINITNNIESKKIDEILINKYEIPELVLMENAARSIFNELDLSKNNYIIAAGPGNNGADGLCVARLLHMIGKNVKIICKSNKSVHYNICKNIGIEFIEHIQKCDIVIDAIFGVGIQGVITGYYKELIDEINNKKDYSIVSVDLPSGNIESDFVIMLSSYKEEMLNRNIPSKVVDIGVNFELYKDASNKFLVDEEYIRLIKKERDIFSNKGDFGKVKIYAKKGAALLASSGSIKSGSGYTILLSDSDTLNANLIKNPECLNYPLDYKIETDTVLIGPNLGVTDFIKDIIEENKDKNIVLDADAINYLSQNKEIIKQLSSKTVITPHLLEFSRISGFELEYIHKHPFEALKRFKNDFKGCILLKGKNTIIYDGENFYIINIGNSKMANAGMGDLLSGMISSYMAQKYSPLEALIYAAYKHAYEGSSISRLKEVVNPSDIIEKL